MPNLLISLNATYVFKYIEEQGFCCKAFEVFCATLRKFDLGYSLLNFERII